MKNKILFLAEFKENCIMINLIVMNESDVEVILTCFD